MDEAGDGGKLSARNSRGKWLIASGTMIALVNPNGDPVVSLRSWNKGGSIQTQDHAGNVLFSVAAKQEGKCSVRTYNAKGQELVELSATDSGGYVKVLNTTGEPVCTMTVDEYGNGEIGAWNREGKGRMLTPVP